MLDEFLGTTEVNRNLAARVSAPGTAYPARRPDADPLEERRMSGIGPTTAGSSATRVYELADRSRFLLLDFVGDETLPPAVEAGWSGRVEAVTVTGGDHHPELAGHSKSWRAPTAMSPGRAEPVTRPSGGPSPHGRSPCGRAPLAREAEMRLLFDGADLDVVGHFSDRPTTAPAGTTNPGGFGRSVITRPSTDVAVTSPPDGKNIRVVFRRGKGGGRGRRDPVDSVSCRV